MIIVEPYAKIISYPATRWDGCQMLKRLEEYGRVSYRSEDKTTPDSYMRFIKMLMDKGHLSVIEHESVTVEVLCDRGVSHEIVRHRLASYTQESTRYCNYNKTGELSLVCPFNWPSPEYDLWVHMMQHCEDTYNELVKNKVAPQFARSVLPNSLATKLIWTQNLRGWRHTFIERTNKAAHPQMRQIMIPLLKEFQDRIPIIYDDIVPDDEPSIAKKRLQ